MTAGSCKFPYGYFGDAICVTTIDGTLIDDCFDPDFLGSYTNKVFILCPHGAGNGGRYKVEKDRKTGNARVYIYAEKVTFEDPNGDKEWEVRVSYALAEAIGRGEMYRMANHPPFIAFPVKNSIVIERVKKNPDYGTVYGEFKKAPPEEIERKSNRREEALDKNAREILKKKVREILLNQEKREMMCDCMEVSGIPSCKPRGYEEQIAPPVPFRPAKEDPKAYCSKCAKYMTKRDDCWGVECNGVWVEQGEIPCNAFKPKDDGASSDIDDGGKNNREFEQRLRASRLAKEAEKAERYKDIDEKVNYAKTGGEILVAPTAEYYFTKLGQADGIIREVSGILEKAYAIVLNAPQEIRELIDFDAKVGFTVRALTDAVQQWNCRVHKHNFDLPVKAPYNAGSDSMQEMKLMMGLDGGVDISLNGKCEACG